MRAYTTMTRGKVLRLIARGWEPSCLLDEALFLKYPYYEIVFIRAGYFRGISGFGYRGGE